MIILWEESSDFNEDTRKATEDWDQQRGSTFEKLVELLASSGVRGDESNSQ